ncbi:MAG: bifunctional oligoribonuclease/PAP phosphatase NrnA [Gemmataceae bacterium]
MTINWQPWQQWVARHRHFMLTTHVRPDGDGLGSMKALARALEVLGRQTSLVLPSSLPDRYRFLFADCRVLRYEPGQAQWAACDGVVILDTGTWNQLGELGAWLRDTPVERVVIDHHRTQDDLGAQCFVDPAAEATGRLTREAIAALGVALDAVMAEALFVAVAMDTGWFRHSNVRPETFALAAELARHGVCPERLYNQLFEQNSLARMRLMAEVLDRLTLTAQGQVAYSYILLDDYARLGATPQDSEDLVNVTLAVAGVHVGLLFMEQPRGGTKVSLRSRDRVDVGRLAESFGGGGHKQAAGVLLPTSLEQARATLLSAVEKCFPPG